MYKRQICNSISYNNSIWNSDTDYIIDLQRKEKRILSFFGSNQAKIITDEQSVLRYVLDKIDLID